MTIDEMLVSLTNLKDAHGGGDIQVMFKDPNSNGGPFGVSTATIEIAEEDEYPEDWNMPEGFTFVLLEA